MGTGPTVQQWHSRVQTYESHDVAGPLAQGPAVPTELAMTGSNHTSALGAVLLLATDAALVVTGRQLEARRDTTPALRAGVVVLRQATDVRPGAPSGATSGPTTTPNRPVQPR